MIKIFFLLEEESAKQLIDNLIPRIFPNLNFRCIPFRGKQDLEKNIPIKLRAFKTPDIKFIILRDEDSGNCKLIKQNLADLCKNVQKPDTLIRIACKELESWYFGDLKSVEIALGLSSLSEFTRQKRYRIPDNIVNPKYELKKITKSKYQQVSSSREIGKIIDFNNNSSHSFKIFIEGIRKIIHSSQ